MSLRRRLLRSILAGVLLTFLAGGVLVYFHAVDKVDTEMTAALAVGARIAANAVDDAEEIANARHRLALIVKDFNGDRHLDALVIGDKGQVVLRSYAKKASDEVPDWFYRLFSGRNREAAVPLPPAFDAVGRFVLRTAPRNEIAEAWNDMLNALTILAILTLLVSGSVYWIVSSALRPLDHLAAAFSDFGQSAEPRYVSETGPEEFSRVYRAFNSMVARQCRMEAANRELNEQIQRVQEEERADIARDLHDEIGPFLFNVDIDASAILKHTRQRDWEAIDGRVRNIRKAVGHVQRHVRGILSRLRPAALIDLGLRDALESEVGSWRLRHPGIAISLACDVPTLAQDQEDTIFRLVQESLSNAVRHGQPSRIGIEVGERAGEIEVRIADDGCGMGEAREPGFGIRGMTERVENHGGRLDLAPADVGSGVIVTARMPMKTPGDARSNSH